MAKHPLCRNCDDAARTSLANEIRGVLMSRCFWAPGVESDLITAVAAAVDNAVKAEREACAKVADNECASLDGSCGHVDHMLAGQARDIADAIRKRGG